MTVYITSFAFAIFGAWLYQREFNAECCSHSTPNRYFRKKPRTHTTSCILLLLSMVPVIMVIGLRYRVGTDYLYYATSFRRVASGAASFFSSNPLYSLIEKIVGIFTNNIFCFFSVIAFIMIFCYWYVFAKQSENIMYSIFLFAGTNLFFISLNAVRQGLAMSLLFVALYFVIKKKPIPYLIATLCAVLIHRGVIVFLPVYLFAHKKLKPIFVWIILAASVGVGFAGSSILRIVVKFVGYERYMSSALDNNKFEWVLTLINLAILAVQCFYYAAAQESKYKEEFNIYFWMQMLATSAIILSIAVPLTKRLCWTFSIGQMLSLPLMSKLETSKIGKIVLNSAIIILFSLSIYIGIVQNGAHGVLPFQWFTSQPIQI